MLQQENTGNYASDVWLASSHDRGSGQEPTPVRSISVPTLTEANMQSLSLEYARTRDPRLRAALILYHQKLVHSVATRFAGGGEALEDLVQVGTIGLINALDRYDASREVKFSSYAVPTIVGEIKRHFRDKTWHVKVPRWLQDLSLSVRKAQQALSDTLHRAPTIHELSEYLGVSEENTLQALEIGHISSAVSLDTQIDPGAGGDGATLMDLIGRVDSALHDIEAYSDLWRVLDQLDNRERQVIQLRFFEDMSQAKIARLLNTSQMHVSRLQQRALLRLRAGLLDGTLHKTRAGRRSAPGRR